MQDYEVGLVWVPSLAAFFGNKITYKLARSGFALEAISEKPVRPSINSFFKNIKEQFDSLVNRARGCKVGCYGQGSIEQARKPTWARKEG